MSDSSSTLRYSNPPVWQAIMEFTLLPDGKRPRAAIERFVQQLEAQFPSLSRRQNFQTVVGDGHIDQSVREVGFEISSADLKRTLVVELDRFAYHLNGSYTSWEDFSGEALDFWNAYLQSVANAEITRVGVRFINRFDLPYPVRVDQFFTLYPAIPDSFPATPTGYAQRLSFAIEGESLGATIQSGPLPLERPNIVPVVLDIDVFRVLPEDSLLNGVSDTEKLHRLLAQLRVHKNSLFNASITEETKELIR